MTWACELTADAERDLQGLPRAVQRGVPRVLDHMASGPFHGDGQVLKGAGWQGVFRRRTGSYRILRILIRSKETYR
jgi:mRNA-degrading endonuclease RelE of RelBE toxin-antitoxin system